MTSRRDALGGRAGAGGRRVQEDAAAELAEGGEGDGSPPVAADLALDRTGQAAAATAWLAAGLPAAQAIGQPVRPVAEARAVGQPALEARPAEQTVDVDQGAAGAEAVVRQGDDRRVPLRGQFQQAPDRLVERPQAGDRPPRSSRAGGRPSRPRRGTARAGAGGCRGCGSGPSGPTSRSGRRPGSAASAWARKIARLRAARDRRSSSRRGRPFQTILCV